MSPEKRQQIINEVRFKLKAAMLKLSLCDYNDAYILVKRTVTVVRQGADVAAIAADRNIKQVIFKN